VNDRPPEAPVDVRHGPPERGAWQVTAPVLADMRHRVHDAARRAGLGPDDADRFTVAVNEVVINALQHGGGVAEVSIGYDSGVVVTVADRGSGFVLDGPLHLPPPDQEHGRGLWLVHRLCDDVSVDRGPDGTRVRLRAGPRS
jgi:anti-sigma regulatory factor (Ser/Thr protein kinase)